MDPEETAMVVLRFSSEDVRRACCDTALMRRLWGHEVARRISRRLQQLEALTTLADLSFLPFDSRKHDGGVIEVAVADRLAIFIKPGQDTSEGEKMHTIVVSDLRDSSSAEPKA